MKNIIRNIIGCGLLFCTVISCQEKTPTIYESGAALNFHKSKYSTEENYQSDSMSYTFFVKSDNLTEDNINIYIASMGLSSDKDRAIKIRQTNGGTNAAIAGTHYLAFDSEEMQKYLIMPAGKALASIPIKIYRHPSMNLQEFRLELEIVGNEEFKVGIPELQKFVMKFSAIASKPTSWDKSWIYAFGNWGSKKMWFIINYVGFSDFENPQDYQQDMRDYFKMKASRELEAYNIKMGTELMEEDGVTKVEFPK